MEKIIDFLNANPKGWLATIDENGMPRNRPFLFLLDLHNRLFWGTDNTKEVYRQLMTHPYIEFGSTSTNFVTIRIRGEVLFSENREVKRIAWEKYELLKKIFETDDNPNWEVFYMEHGEAVINDFSGMKPEIIRF